MREKLHYDIKQKRYPKKKNLARFGGTAKKEQREIRWKKEGSG